MSITAIVFIFLAVCMVLGPIFLLQQSKRQKRIASIRTAAAQLGVSVRLQRINDEFVAVYSIIWPADSKRVFSGPESVILKKEYEHELHLLGVWDVKPSDNVNQALNAALIGLLEALPDSVCGVELSAGGVGLYWSEHGGEETLRHLKDSIEQHMLSLWMAKSKPKAM